MLRLYPETARIYLPDGLPPVPPYQGVPAQLRASAACRRRSTGSPTAGLRDFYEGDVAAGIAVGRGRDGRRARRVRICAAARPSITRGAGGAVLPAGMLQLRRRPDRGAHHAARVHRRFCRPAFGGVRPTPPGSRALAAAMKAVLRRPPRAGLGEAEPRAAESCTTHITTCDEAGGMVAMTTTLLSSMGSRVVLPGSGVLMNNGIMWFDTRDRAGPTRSRPASVRSPTCCRCMLRDGDAAGAGRRRVRRAAYHGRR